MTEPIHKREVVLLESPDEVQRDVHQVMNPLHPDVFNSLKDSIRDEGILVPLLLDKDFAVIDGHNRVLCWKELLEEGVEIGKVPALVYDAATKYDAYRIAVTTNSVRRDPTTAKPELVRKQLMWLDHMYEADGDPPDDRRSWADSRIASTIGIAHDTVKQIRAEMESKGEIATSTRRVSVTIRGGKRIELTSDLAAHRAAGLKGTEAQKAAKVASARPSENNGSVPKTVTVEVPAKVKFGKKEFTPEEAAAELKKLNAEKNKLTAAKKGAEQAEKNLQAQIDGRIDGARQAFLKELANVKARYGDLEPPEFADIDEDAWIAMAKEAQDVRVKEAGGIVRKLYTGFPEMMGQYMPGEAAQAALKMGDSGAILMALEFIQRWVVGVMEEMENEESLATQRTRR